ncbi:MAG: zinc dependent phospholipase C family protein, partial [Elusimicrobiota bacterium]
MMTISSKYVYGLHTSPSSKLTHPWICDKALTLPVFTATTQEITDSDYKSYLIQGSIDEDGYSYPYEETLTHFYNPDTGKGLYFLLVEWKDAKTWSNELLPIAASYYAQGRKVEAYWYLGRIAHLVQDMSSPAHVLLQAHTGGDPYENYCQQHGRYGDTSITGDPDFIIPNEPFYGTNFDDFIINMSTTTKSKYKDYNTQNTLSDSDGKSMAEYLFPKVISWTGGLFCYMLNNYFKPSKVTSPDYIVPVYYFKQDYSNRNANAGDEYEGLNAVPYDGVIVDNDDMDMVLPYKFILHNTKNGDGDDGSDKNGKVDMINLGQEIAVQFAFKNRGDDVNGISITLKSLETIYGESVNGDLGPYFSSLNTNQVGTVDLNFTPISINKIEAVLTISYYDNNTKTTVSQDKTFYIEIDNPYEPNDDYSSAYKIESNNEYFSYIYPEFDEDWYK